MKKQAIAQPNYMVGNTIQRSITYGPHPAHIHHHTTTKSEAGSCTKKSAETLYHNALQPISGTPEKSEKTGSKSEVLPCSP